MTGIHISSPGLVLDSAAVLGSVIPLTPGEAAVLDLANLKYWWSAKDAVVLGTGGISWADRKAGAVLTGTPGSTPTKTTLSGAAVLDFTNSPVTYLDGLASLALTNNFTVVIKVRTKTGWPNAALFAGLRAADNDGPWIYAFANGTIAAQVRSGQQATTASATIAAGVTSIIDWSWDGTIHRIGKNNTALSVTNATPATSGAAPTPTQATRVGYGKSTVPLSGYIFDIMIFDLPMRSGDAGRAAQLTTAINAIT